MIVRVDHKGRDTVADRDDSGVELRRPHLLGVRVVPVSSCNQLAVRSDRDDRPTGAAGLQIRGVTA